VVSKVSELISIKKTICLGMVLMSLTLPLLALTQGVVLTAVALSLVAIAYAFLLNPTSAELGNAVDRRGLNCYSAVYAIYNIAYAVGQMAASGFAPAAAPRL